MKLPESIREAFQIPGKSGLIIRLATRRIHCDRIDKETDMSDLHMISDDKEALNSLKHRKDWQLEELLQENGIIREVQPAEAM